MDKIKQLKEIINGSKNLVFFGGAGVSTESRIPDFRSENGLFTTKFGEALPPERILSYSFFMQNPEEFYRFYRSKMLHPSALPNIAHTALAKLETSLKLTAVITQNIDGLHQNAGSKNVYELHGSVQHNHCIQCDEYYALDYILQSKSIIPNCKICNGIIKPDVVLYEERLNDEVVINAVKAINTADTLIVGGTSLVVYPAAGFLTHFIGSKLVLINRGATDYDKHADLVINDSIGAVFSQVVLL